MNLTGKANLNIGLAFVIAGLILIIGWKNHETIYFIAWVAIILGGIIGILGFVNVFFEKPDLAPQDFSNLSDTGIKLWINRFPAFMVFLMPGGLLIAFTIAEALKKNFDFGFWVTFLASLGIIYFSIGWLLMKYTLYPDRISVRNILSLPFYKNILLSDIVSVRTLSKSEERDRMANRPTRNKAAQGAALIMFSFAKQGNYGSVILETKNKKVELDNVRYPENLINAINNLKKL